MKCIVIFASGSGSNAENIITHFRNHDKEVDFYIFTNKKEAKVIERCNRLNVPAFYFNRSAFKAGGVLKMIEALQPNLIVLAGFLWKIPKSFVSAFPNKIVNIHPALLPKYGGKGMYGMHVHNAVKANNEKETGITIHYVNEYYDEGAIIKQAITTLSSDDTVDDIAQKVHSLEYEHFPIVIESLI